MGIHRAAGLDVDGIVAAVESVIPEFSASRVSPDTLTGPKASNLSAALYQAAPDAQTPSKNQNREGK